MRATKTINLVSTTVLACLALALALIPSNPANAASAVGLGTATSFAVLAGGGITNTGATTITGDVGTFPTPAETGFNTVTLNGNDHAGDAVTQQAKIDFTTAYNQAAASGPATAVATELGSNTFTPGVYSNTTLGITGTATLDALGNPNAVFIFKTGSTLITASNSSVALINGASACNVFWQVASSATLGTNSTLVGTVLASTAVTANTGAGVQGRLLAGTAAVTLQANVITNAGCTTPGGGTATTTTTSTSTPVTAVTTTPVTSSATSGSGGSGTTNTIPRTGGINPSVLILGGASIVFGAALLSASTWIERRRNSIYVALHARVNDRR